MPLDPRIRKALLNNRNQMKSTRVNQVLKYAKEKDIKGVTKKSILEYLKDTNPNKSFDGKKASKQFVFHFIGGWFADIGFNRNKKMGEQIDGKNWLKQFVLFVNGNSGWAKVYEAPAKSQPVVSSIVQRFIKDMGDYPVKRIVTDNDGCFDDKSLPIQKIQSEVANNENEEYTNHRLFSRIDTFMSHLRKYAWNEYNTGTINGKRPKICDQPPDEEFYIPLDTINRFVWEWNQHVIPIVRCTRNEMMNDRNLELAYICHALYGNSLKNELRKAITGEVKLKSKVRFNDLGANRQERANGVRAGTYVINRTQNGHYVGVDKEGREVHFNASDVANIHDDAPQMFEETELADVEDEVNDEQQWANMVTKYNGPPVETQTRERPKKQKEPEEVPLESVARAMAIEDQNKDMARGFAPSLSTNEIYEATKKYLNYLKRADIVSYDTLLDELGIRPLAKPKKVTKETIQNTARSMNIVAASGSPYNEQDIPVEAAAKVGTLVKKRRQQRARKQYARNG